jgi:hypothetical protein
MVLQLFVCVSRGNKKWNVDALVDVISITKAITSFAVSILLLTNCITALLNELSSLSAFQYGSPVSVTSRLRRTWNPSALKFTPTGWRFHSAQFSSNKPMAESASDPAKGPGISRRIRSDTRGKRILWVDLVDKIEYGVGEEVHYSPNVASTKKGGEVGEIWNMMKKLRRPVREDRWKAPFECIDSVMWYTYYSVQPTAWMWRVLDELSPKHLELFASTDHEDCNIKPLNTLRRQWNNLESLTLRNICDPNFMKRAPKVFSRISYLTLDHCLGHGTDYLPSDVTRLKHLRILENNPCDMLCYGVDNLNIPNLTKDLEVLEIKSYDFSLWL